MSREKVKLIKKARRIRRIKKKVVGTDERPRMAFTKTNRHLHAQIINDMKGVTIVGMSTTSKEIKDAFKDKKSLKNKDVAKKLAELIAKKAVEKNVKKIVFDRRGRKYMGVVKIFADTLRENGLEF